MVLGKLEEGVTNIWSNFLHFKLRPNLILYKYYIFISKIDIITKYFLYSIINYYI